MVKRIIILLLLILFVTSNAFPQVDTTPPATPSGLMITSGGVLVWDAGTETDLAGYKVHYGTIYCKHSFGMDFQIPISLECAELYTDTICDPLFGSENSFGDYDFVVDVGNDTEYELSDLNEGVNYLSVTAYNTSGLDGMHSNEVYFLIDDGIASDEDNCPCHHNPDQLDTYPTGGNSDPAADLCCGDACECEGDFEGDGDVDGTDAVNFKLDFFRKDCAELDPCKGDFECDGDVDGTDAVQFKADFFRSDCPSCCGWPCVYE